MYRVGLLYKYNSRYTVNQTYNSVYSLFMLLLLLLMMMTGVSRNYACIVQARS
jgi:hypothetical protein